MRTARALAVLPVYVVTVMWLTWPLAERAATHLPSTVGACRFDTKLIGWILAHETHALATVPSTFVHGNMYHPAPYALFHGPLALGALPFFAPVFAFTGNPTLALNVAFLAGAALSAWAVHVVLAGRVGSELAGAVGGVTFLTTRWLLWEFVPTDPYYAYLEFLPFIVVAAAAPDVRVRWLLPLLVLQCLTDVAFVAVVVLAPLACIAVARLVLPSRRSAGLRLLAAVAATPVLLAPIYAGYWAVRIGNPHIAEQTNWRGLGSTEFPWLGQPLTELPWGLLGDLAPSGVAPFVLALVAVGLLSALLRTWRRAPMPARSLWLHALLWTVLGLAMSLTPAVVWNGQVIDLPHRALADFGVLQVLREPGRLGIAALIGLSLLAGLAFAECEAHLPAARPRLARALRIGLAGLVLAAIYVEYARGFSFPFRRRPLPASYPLLEPDAPGPFLIELRDGRGPLLELPVGPGGVTPFFHAGPLYRSIFHWRPLLNGYNGYWPAGFPERMALASRLPEPEALAALRRETGLETILVHNGTPGAIRIDPAAHAAWSAIAERGGRKDLRLIARRGDDLLFQVGE